MIDTALFAFLVVIVLGIAVALMAIYYWHYDFLNQDAGKYLYQRRDAYRTSDAYRALTPNAAREVLTKLRCLPQWCTHSDANFWYEEYTQMLEFFLALCDDPKAEPQLVHGVFEEPVRIHGHRTTIIQELVWMKYTYSGREWVLWVDATREPFNGGALRNDSDGMFHNFGRFIQQSNPVPQADVLCILFEYLHCTN